MKETILCRICLEPIFNPICVNCLCHSIKNWLSNNSSEILSSFTEFDKNLKNIFESSQERERCVKCKDIFTSVICTYCYSKEVYDFLSLKDKKLAEDFIRIFNFDFLKVGHSFNFMSTKNLIPIMIVDKQSNSDINICEACGNQSDDLKEFNGSYICEVCRDEACF